MKFSCQVLPKMSYLHLSGVLPYTEDVFESFISKTEDVISKKIVGQKLSVFTLYCCVEQERIVSRSIEEEELFIINFESNLEMKSLTNCRWRRRGHVVERCANLYLEEDAFV